MLLTKEVVITTDTRTRAQAIIHRYGRPKRIRRCLTVFNTAFQSMTYNRAALVNYPKHLVPYRS